jgi:predicted DNA-binding ribbon-helix-helix protein
MVNTGVNSNKPMALVKKTSSKDEGSEDATTRASISFPTELYRTLEEIAHEKKVSLAWVVRDAAEQYVAARWPLFKGRV